MKLLPMLLVHVLIAGVVVFVYDRVRGQPDASTPSLETASTAELEARIAALESARPVELRTDGATAGMLQRLEALEARLAGLGTDASVQPPGETVDEPSGVRSGGTVARPGGGEPSPEEIARFRELQQAARAAEKRAKLAQRMDARLATTGVRLSDAARAQVLVAYEAFGPRYQEIWSEAKSSASERGGDVAWDTLIRETTTTIQREFSERLASVLPQADAEAVSAALYPHRAK